MRATRIAAVGACAAAAMVFSAGACGDAPCHKGFRDSTPSERATMTAILQAAKKALPPAPAGWVIVGAIDVGTLATKVPN